MIGINKNIYFQENIYNKLVENIGLGKLSKFVNQVVEEKLIELEKIKEEQLEKQLIAGYKARSNNQKIKNMIQEYGKSSWNDISLDLFLREKEYEQRSK